MKSQNRSPGDSTEASTRDLAGSSTGEKETPTASRNNKAQMNSSKNGNNSVETQDSYGHGFQEYSKGSAGTSLEALYGEYSIMVYKYLVSLSHDPALAEDLMQDTFLKASRKIDTWKGQSRLSTWLCAIAANEWKMYLRKHPAMTRYEYEEELDRIQNSSLANRNAGSSSRSKSHSFHLPLSRPAVRADFAAETAGNTDRKNDKKYSFKKTGDIIPASASQSTLKNSSGGTLKTVSEEDLFLAIHTLSEPAREIVYLRMYGELSFAKIGEIFGKSENWARVTFYRAKEKLRKELIDGQ